MDQEKTGALIRTLRTQKSLTQKALAEAVGVGDKAVSKWETAASVPSIDLLIPLADLLGVTVTELLMCRRMEQDNALSAAQVEQVVKTAVSYSDKQPRAYQKNRKWGLIYLLSLLIASILALLSGSFLCRRLRGSTSISAPCNNLIVLRHGKPFLSSSSNWSNL